MGNYAGTTCVSQDHTCFSKEEGGGVETVYTADKLKPADGTWHPAQPHVVLPDTVISTIRNAGLEKSAERSAGVGSIVSAMLGFADDAKIQTRSCRSLLSIAQQPSHQQKVVAAGSIEAIVGAMQMHPADEELQQLACTVLGYLASLQEGQSRLLAADGVYAIIASMGNHPESLAIQRAGCQALVNVPQILEDPQFTTTDAVVNVVLSAMRSHPSDSCMQESACGILWGASLHEVGRSLVVSCGGVETIIAAMRDFPGALGIQRLGCGLSLHISTCPNFQRPLVDCGGLSAVISAVRAHPQDVRILRRVCGVLGALGASRQFTKALGEVGAISAILATLPKHRNQISVQESACEALRILVQGGVAALDEEEVKTVIAEMVLVLVELPEVKLREVAMRIIYFLINDTNLKTVEAAGTLEAVVFAMQAHAAEPSIQDAGKMILDALLKAQLGVQKPSAEFGRSSSRNRSDCGSRTPTKESRGQERSVRSRSPHTHSPSQSQHSEEQEARSMHVGDIADGENIHKVADNREYTFCPPPKKSPPKVGKPAEDPFSSASEAKSFACLQRNLPREFENITNVIPDVNVPHVSSASSNQSVDHNTSSLISPTEKHDRGPEPQTLASAGEVDHGQGTLIWSPPKNRPMPSENPNAARKEPMSGQWSQELVSDKGGRKIDFSGDAPNERSVGQELQQSVSDKVSDRNIETSSDPKGEEAGFVLDVN